MKIDIGNLNNFENSQNQIGDLTESSSIDGINANDYLSYRTDVGNDGYYKGLAENTTDGITDSSVNYSDLNSESLFEEITVDTNNDELNDVITSFRDIDSKEYTNKTHFGNDQSQPAENLGGIDNNGVIDEISTDIDGESIVDSITSFGDIDDDLVNDSFVEPQNVDTISEESKSNWDTDDINDSMSTFDNVEDLNELSDLDDLDGFDDIDEDGVGGLLDLF